MSPQMSQHTIEQVHKLDNIQRRDFKAIIRNPDYLVSAKINLFFLCFLLHPLISLLFLNYRNKT